jgi:hypothetical protein
MKNAMTDFRCRCGGKCSGPHGASDGSAIMICDSCGANWYFPVDRRQECPACAMGLPKGWKCDVCGRVAS